MSAKNSRRSFLKYTTLTGAGVALGMPTTNAQIPAIAGGDPIRTKPWPVWPQWDPVADEKPVVEVLRSGIWSRASVVTEFEKQWAATIGAKRALTTANGTNALITSLTQLDIGGGDEVILPPYTFIATLAAILATGAMPVFADIDPQTFQIDPKKIESKITTRTRAILPVHICGLPADMPRIMSIAKQHNLVVVEDACQAWLAEINHQKVGTFGNAGCFSFQNSKNLPIGEGGAIVSNDDALMDRCHSYHNYGISHGSAPTRPGTKLRMTEYQAAIGLAQLKRLEGQTAIRNTNAAWLRSKISAIPGIVPYTFHDNVTRAAFHLFPFRYKTAHFAGLPKQQFLQAMKAEGIPCSGGYAPLNTAANLGITFQTKNYRNMYPAAQLDVQAYVDRNRCAENDLLCEEAVWFSQNLLLGNEADMKDIVHAIEKVQKNAAAIKAKK